MLLLDLWLVYVTILWRVVLNNGRFLWLALPLAVNLPSLV